MRHPARNAGIVLVAALFVACVMAGANGPWTYLAAPAGTVRTSAGPILILNVTPWNGETTGSSTPAIVAVFGDTNPGATVDAVDFELDGMNLTSAGMFNETVFVLPLALELRNGPHLASFTAFDNVGGSGSLSWMFTVDTIPPILLVTAPVYPIVPVTGVLVQGTALLANATLFAGAAPITVTATVLPAGIRSSASPAANGSFAIPVPLTEGVNTIFVNATDRLGNFATVLKNIVRDMTKPPLVVLTPSAMVSATSTVWVSGRTEPGAFVIVNGYNVAVSPLDGAWGVNLTLPEGINILTIAAADSVGNFNATGLGILVDSDAPKITLSSPLPGLMNHDRVLVQGTVTDTRLVALLVNGVPVTWDATGAFQTTLTLPEGITPIVVVAVDAALHTTIARTEVTIDTTPPVVRVATPPDGLETNQSTVVIRGTVDDANATVLVNGQELRPDAGGRWQTSVALVSGGNTILVSAVDAAGNRAATIAVHVEDFSPFPDLANRTTANAQNLDALGVMVRLSLVGILLLALAVEFVLYSRSSKRIRETRSLVAALARERKEKPKP